MAFRSPGAYSENSISERLECWKIFATSGRMSSNLFGVLGVFCQN